jgi:hypothetical protein
MSRNAMAIVSLPGLACPAFRENRHNPNVENLRLSGLPVQRFMYARVAERNAGIAANQKTAAANISACVQLRL